MKKLVIILALALSGCASQSLVSREFYEPNNLTAFKREDGTTVGAVKSEVYKSGSPDWSDEKHFSILSIGK